MVSWKLPVAQKIYVFTHVGSNTCVSMSDIDKCKNLYLHKNTNTMEWHTCYAIDVDFNGLRIILF